MHGVGRIGAILSAFAGAEMMALNLPFESVFLILGIPAALTVAGLAAKGIFAAGHPSVASTSPRLCAERHSGIWFPVQSADCTAFSS